MLVCDECRKSSDEVPLSIKGIVFTGSPKEYVVISVLCQKCDGGKAGRKAKIKLGNLRATARGSGQEGD